MAHGDWPRAPGRLSSWRRLLGLSRLANGSSPFPAPRPRALLLLPPFSLRSPGPAKLVSQLRDGASRLPSAAAAAAHGRDRGRAQPSALPLSLPGAERGWTASLSGQTHAAQVETCAHRARRREVGPPAVASASLVPRPGSCGRSQQSQCSRLPGGRARHPAPPAASHFPAALLRPGHHPGSVTAPAWKAGGATAPRN